MGGVQGLITVWENPEESSSRPPACLASPERLLAREIGSRLRSRVEDGPAEARQAGGREEDSFGFSRLYGAPGLRPTPPPAWPRQRLARDRLEAVAPQSLRTVQQKEVSAIDKVSADSGGRCEAVLSYRTFFHPPVPGLPGLARGLPERSARGRCAVLEDGSRRRRSARTPAGARRGGAPGEGARMGSTRAGASGGMAVAGGGGGAPEVVSSGGPSGSGRGPGGERALRTPKRRRKGGDALSGPAAARSLLSPAGESRHSPPAPPPGPSCPPPSPPGPREARSARPRGPQPRQRGGASLPPAGGGAGRRSPGPPPAALPGPETPRRPPALPIGGCAKETHRQTR